VVKMTPSRWEKSQKNNTDMHITCHIYYITHWISSELMSIELVSLVFYSNFLADWMWNVIWQYEEKSSLLCFHHCVAYSTMNIRSKGPHVYL